MTGPGDDLTALDRTDGYLPIGDHGLIGDGSTAALVGRDGAVSWLCAPRFDDEPLFCALLDARRGGALRLAPAELVAGLPQNFHVRSWLYRTELEPWCRPVLNGVPVDPESEPTPGPVAWVGTPEGRRTFYTSLGHQDDFERAEFRTLLHNAVAWTLAGS